MKKNNSRLITFQMFQQLNEGTGNFYTKNATKTFVIEFDEGDDFQETLSDLKGTFKHHKYIDADKFDWPSGESYGVSSSYGINPIASTHLSKDFKDDGNVITTCVTIYVGLRPGYYSHANLDWDFEISIDDKLYSFDQWQDFDAANFNDMYDISMSTLKKIEDFVSKSVDKLTHQTEKIFLEVSKPYNVGYRFSNGETGYTPA